MIEICIDNFAGGGGASQGIEAALGRPIDVAINHDRDAIAMHKANHPHTRHYQEDVWKVDPLEAIQGRPVGLGWFSPDCKYFSKAKGGKPIEKKIGERVRGLAGIVLKWGKLPKHLRPRVIILENVEEFQDWGPLLDDGTPCPFRKGFNFRRWWAQLENLGYILEMRQLRACDYGAPTSRKRLFIIARCDGLPIVWPAAMFGPLLSPYRTAADCVDWELPVPSIFLTKAEAKIWGEIHGVKAPKRPLVDATLRRIARGTMRYVLNNPRPFIVPLTHHGSDRVHSIDEPFRTITGANRGELAFAAPTLIQVGYGERKGQAPRCLDLQSPLGTIMAQGNKHALCTAFLARHFGNSVGQGMLAPHPTITADGGGHSALIASQMIKLNGESPAQFLREVRGSSLHYQQVRAFLLKYYGTQQNPRLEFPLGTVTTKHRFGLVTVYGEDYAIADIGMRMFSPRELFRAQGFPDDYIIDPLVRRIVRKREVIKPLSSTGQIRMCGNSVPPPVAEALVRANYSQQRFARAA